MAQQRTIGTHRTTVSTTDGVTRVVYWNTTIVEFDSGRIVLRSGKWETQTTKTRMNQASNQYNLGYSVRQKGYRWFVWYKGEVLEFYDGIVLDRG